MFCSGETIGVSRQVQVCYAMCVWDKTMEHNSNKIFDTIDVRKSLQIITDIILTGPEMSCLSASDSEMLLDSVKQSKKRLN